MDIGFKQQKIQSSAISIPFSYVLIRSKVKDTMLYKRSKLLP